VSDRPASGGPDREHNPPKNALPAKPPAAKAAPVKKTAAKRVASTRQARAGTARADGEVEPAAEPDLSKLPAVLRDLRQGDLISLGAVSIVGRGPSDATAAANTHPGQEELWALTVDSDIGWYAIVSGPCDIERLPAVEPCLAIAPLRRVSDVRYAELRSGYSPREFPLPAEKLARKLRTPAKELFLAVDLRYVTSLDKGALMHASVETLRPLSAPAQRRFGLWVGNRYARPAHPGPIEEDILGRLGKLVKRLSNAYVTNGPKGRSPQALAVAAAEEWYLSANERMVDIYLIVSEASCKQHFFDETRAAIDAAKLDDAAGRLRAELAAVLPRSGGYAVSVLPRTLHGMTAAQYVSLERWQWADDSDPIAD